MRPRTAGRRLFNPQGGTGSATLGVLPGDLSYNIDYGWFVQVENGGGAGLSKVGPPTSFYRLVRFLTAPQATSTPEPAGTPTPVVTPTIPPEGRRVGSGR